MVFSCLDFKKLAAAAPTKPTPATTIIMAIGERFPEPLWLVVSSIPKTSGVEVASPRTSIGAAEAVSVGFGVAVGFLVGAAVGFGVADFVGVGVGVDDGVGLGDGDGVGVGEGVGVATFKETVNSFESEPLDELPV
ncbi:hypothetical protein A2803_04560 [Candidatus Woesebacteria bacterium RIFCSPHIGHO2_01_FULL_44_21]|uniref:Uncharacterized protein n=1 Tax=Candidatus Woesebacteria bacterium RIFCSPHIGHO2_01_FULL_44_21 TaxID=1802503 RepID=A0A1F7YWG5_9BACT|nr:MAG: hypothetical protein A2803_04560 [Candidatus Woesebacteria bacterium RIFCSPHIGHO2_01_FULL_44_21]OGM71344.1 MAG: hypothetical protein A2897_00925 [Candidatus Woesebacteria bacterium RIFCSPLOWO2_01_FULL_44_24b]